MRRIVNDISNGRNINDNLVHYLSGMKQLNNRFALVRLALNYYTYYQIDFDEETKREGNREIAEKVHRVIRDAVLRENISTKEGMEALNQNRAVIIKEVEALTHYVDAFKIYEHALNRVEYRFRDDELPRDYSDEELCRMLMQYILSDEDSVVINSKISEVIAELPIRMTKAKFFEYVANGLSIYQGSDKSTLDDFLYMIKTSAMIPEDMEPGEIFPELEETLSAFEQTDFANIDKNEYQMLFRSVEDVSVYIEDTMNVSMMLMEVINDTYSILLTREYAQKDKVDAACREIIAAVNDYFVLGSEMDEETEDMLSLLEGSQESLYTKLNTYNILDQIRSSYGSSVRENGLEKGYADLKKLEILSSDSLFMELEEKGADIVVDDLILEKETEKLIEEFKILFSNNGKNINRAVMSSVLAGLPVFFNNISELQDFIYQTLYNCQDRAEKIACVEVLHQIMEE